VFLETETSAENTQAVKGTTAWDEALAGYLNGCCFFFVEN